VDKYFEASYRTLIYVPRCVIAPSMATALLENAKFESWNAFFQLIERRRANKADRKWLEQFSIFEKSRKDKEDKSKVAGLGITTMLVGWSPMSSIGWISGTRSADRWGNCTSGRSDRSVF
jgi:hypothetical protein